MSDLAVHAVEQLRAVRDSVLATPTISSILDLAWFDSIEREIVDTGRADRLQSDQSGFVFDFAHPLRGVDWFEEAQRRVLDGRADEVDARTRGMVEVFGIDHLHTVIPKLDARLAAYARLPFRQDFVRRKLAQLRATRGGSDFKNHLFEVAVLGDLALKDVLRDIEDEATSADGVIEIDGRRILVEATHTTQDLIPRDHGPGAFTVDPNAQVDQVVRKVRKKVAEGKQLALADGNPTVLFLARQYYGAGSLPADMALEECFGSPECARLSGVVLADSWRFHQTSWRPAVSPAVPLLPAEAERLSSWYERT